jgi:DNA-binding MarR family transcriptional regulator
MDSRLKLAFVINQTARCLNAEADRVLQDQYGISYLHYLTLIGVSYLQPCLQKQLAEFTQVTSAGMMHTLKPLEQRGWVQKRISAKNRRSVTITLTPKGKAILSEINKLLSRRLQQTIVMNDSETKSLAASLERQLDNIKKYDYSTSSTKN